MGRLALIADDLGSKATATAIRERMKQALAPWLAGTNPDPLKYDTKYGGITALAGLTDSEQHSSCRRCLPLSRYLQFAFSLFISL